MAGVRESSQQSSSLKDEGYIEKTMMQNCFLGYLETRSHQPIFF
ncbi:hypothetical protein ACK3F5_06365 [Photorhabdus asymbiotica UENP]